MAHGAAVSTKLWPFLVALAGPAAIYLAVKVTMDGLPAAAAAGMAGVSRYGLDWFWFNKGDDLAAILESGHGPVDSWVLAMVAGFHAAWLLPVAILAVAAVLRAGDRRGNAQGVMEALGVALSGLALLGAIHFLQFGIAPGDVPMRGRMLLMPSQALGAGFSTLVEGAFFFATGFFVLGTLFAARDALRAFGRKAGRS